MTGSGDALSELAQAASSVESLADLARVLRQLRRRQARLTEGPELTYREIAAKTGWSTAIVGGYLTGTALPPTDRFDTMVRLLGAAPKEQGCLATARDRVADGRRHGDSTRSAWPPGSLVPRQLPAPSRGFVGRAEQLSRLDALLADGSTAADIVIVALSGTAGVGKSALAVHWAHRVADQFPDGQVYVNLRGFDPNGSATTPAEAVRGFLDALGVPTERVPTDLAAQVGLYRSLVADRRLLVLLDNARDADQVRTLLPGGVGCVVVTTSRDRLTSLVAAEGAHPLMLDVLNAHEARELLVVRLGQERVSAEPFAAEEIAARCARLPLALTLVAARGAVHPDFPLATFAAELHLGRAYAWLGRDQEAITHLRAAMELLVELGDTTAQAHIHLDLGMTHDRGGRHQDALADAQKALELFRIGDHVSGQANALNAIGWEHSQLGDYPQALVACEQALTLQREIGDQHAQAGTWDSIAFAHRNLGHHERAIACYGNALQLYRDTGDRYYQAEILTHIGDAHDSVADHASSCDAWEQALVILTELGHPDADQIRAKLTG
jgi:tetratricopeptide (TPR) repeat protein